MIGWSAAARRILFAIALDAHLLGAQDTLSRAVPTAGAIAPAGVHKAPCAGAVLGFILPGAGHWYAQETARGWVVAAVFWSGVAATGGGRRTDDEGKVGRVAIISALIFSVFDGARAVDRYNARLSIATPIRGKPGGALKLQITSRL